MDFDLKGYLTVRRSWVEEALNSMLPIENERPQKLHEAIRYSVLAPGKRLRPTLVIAAAEALGETADLVMPVACALECIHVFSLIHDDLPCMDNDDYRRGRLTSHKVFGEAMALLAGDALLALAFELISANPRSVPLERVVQTMHIVARASGTRGMVGGQVVDMESQGVEVSQETLFYIHEHKTGALISGSVAAGAVMAGGSQQQQASLIHYGQQIGLAFQIADDILDVVGDEARIGKPVGSDEERDKATYPRLFGLEKSREMAHFHVERALDALDEFGTGADPLRAIASYIVERDL